MAVVIEAHLTKKSESASSRDTLAYEHGFALSRVNLLVSFSAWAELVWRYGLEVTNTVNQVRSPGRVQVCEKSWSNPEPNRSPILPECGYEDQLGIPPPNYTTITGNILPECGYEDPRHRKHSY